MKMSKNRWFLFALGAMLMAAPAKAAVTFAELTNYLITGETIGTTSTTVRFSLDAISSIEVDIFRLENISDTPSEENQVAAIQQSGQGVGTHTVGWDALYLLGNDLGRQNGNFQVIVTANDGTNETTYVIPQFLRITSVDIHDVSVQVSTDAAGNPYLPYNISYNLAKAAKVTVKVLDSSGTVVRTLMQDEAQLGEDLRGTPNTLQWNGLNDSDIPAPLGIYTITFDATDAQSGDTATQRTRTVAVFSLARLGSSLDEIFRENAFVFPNPIRDETATFRVRAVRNHASIFIKVYTLTGDLVWEDESHDVATGNIVDLEFNGKNKSGQPLGRGLYYYVVRQEDAEGVVQAVKKLAVIR